MASIDHMISALAIGRPERYQGLAVYPLTRSSGCFSPDYLVLDEALGTRLFHITEVSESGIVPRLLATNEGDTPVFLLDGEELVGSKQNRIVNLSLMLGPKSTTEIPVSCV